MRTKISLATIRGEFVSQVETISGQNLMACNQCGKCSAGCPVAFGMDMLPSQVLRYGQLGMEEVLDSQTIWTCAACLTCVARCPKGIDLPRVMEAMRILATQKQGSHMDSEQLSPDLVGEIPQLAVIGSFRKYTP